MPQGNSRHLQELLNACSITVRTMPLGFAIYKHVILKDATGTSVVLIKVLLMCIINFKTTKYMIVKRTALMKVDNISVKNVLVVQNSTLCAADVTFIYFHLLYYY